MIISDIEISEMQRESDSYCDTCKKDAEALRKALDDVWDSWHDMPRDGTRGDHYADVKHLAAALAALRGGK